MHFVLPDSVRMLLADARKRRGFFDKEVDMVRIAGKPSPFENFREYNFDGDRVYEVVEYDTIAANWLDRSGKPVYFQYRVQIQYHENNAIKSYISFLKVRQSEGGNYFQMGTRYYFDDTGKLRYSLDLDRLYTSPLKEIYKLLYAQKGDFAYEDMHSIYRVYDGKTALWYIDYEKGASAIIDDKTHKIYYADKKNTPRLYYDYKLFIKSAYPKFDLDFKKRMEDEYDMLYW